MTRDETIRLEFTYLIQKYQGVETVCSMIDPILKNLWSDIKSGCLNTETTKELRRWAKELEQRTSEIMSHIDSIDHEIKQISTADQIRMNFKG